jgi:hypothetical protein
MERFYSSPSHWQRLTPVRDQRNQRLDVGAIVAAAGGIRAVADEAQVLAAKGWNASAR